MAHKGLQSKHNTLAALAAVLLALASPAVRAAEVRDFANGIRATIYSPTELLGQANSGLVKSAAGQPLELHTANGIVTLTGDVSALVPFEFADVERALESMHHLQTRVDVNVYLLPAIPLGVGSSFARQDAIFLAPGHGPVDSTTAAYITTHEMGHVLTWAFLDGHPARWEAYLALRGLDAETNGSLAIHADRAREILAEDIRFLFGGREATVSGSIENHDLALPNRVDGLQSLLAGYFSGQERSATTLTASAFPNPCNPLTTVAMSLPTGAEVDAGQAVLRVFDIRGALVKSVTGGQSANGRVSVQWNGTATDGSAVASGHYIYVMQVGGLTAKGAVTLVR